MSLSALQQQENLRLAFDQLDCDSSGFITGDNLQAALAVRQAITFGMNT